MVKNLWEKYKELFFYGVFGVGATVINVASYHILERTVGLPYLVANIIAWILAFIFAFITNKLFVFESRSWDRAVAIKEFSGFVSQTFNRCIRYFFNVVFCKYNKIG